ncbi:MAG: sulfotransferase [Novosphingobium sp.]
MLGVEDRFPAPERFSGALDQLHELAAEQVGSDDFGDGDYLMGLRVLLESMDYDPRFSERGRNIAWGSVLTTLCSRGHAVREMKQLAVLEKVPVERPIVITGLHRTGTTALHKLLSVDPRFQGLQSWLTGAPMPRPPREEWESIPAFQQVIRQLEARFAGSPDLRAAHDMAAEEVDECGGILFHSFVSLVWSSAWSSASYEAWRLTQCVRPSYAYFRRVLKLIGRTEPARRWLLKHPPHIANLDVLFETFPDALVIQTHRDPGKAIPSLCSLVMANHDLMEVGRKDQRARLMGPRETGRAAKALRDAEPVRQAHRGQILDVLHSDFHRDPMAVVRRIYPFAGLELAPDVEAAMQQRIAARPEWRHGTHRYKAGDFGITEDEIRESFADYMDRFDLWPEPAQTMTE